MTDLDYAKVMQRIGLTVGDGPDPDETPDTIWCDGGTVQIVPLNTCVKVAGGLPVPWTGGNAVIECSISDATYVDPTANGFDGAGYLLFNGKPYVWAVDLTSSKVNPNVPDGATHQVNYVGVTAAGTAVSFPSVKVRLTAAGDGISPGGFNDLTILSPVEPGAAVPIVVGPQGVGVADATVTGLGDLELTLTDTTVVNAGPLPVGPGGSDAGVAGYITTPGSQTETALSASTADSIAARESAPKVLYLDSYSTFFRDAAYVWQTGQGNTATTAGAAAAAGDLSLTVASTTGLSAGVVIVTGAGTAQMQQRKIASIAGSTLTLDAALTYAVASGATVSPLWKDDRHLTHDGFLAFGYFIANAKDSGGNYIITGTAPKVTYLCNSWVDQDGPAYSVPLLARIPGATFVDAGVSGDESDLLLARFDTDVPSDSDYVVINEPGVNDVANVANGYTAGVMGGNLQALWEKAQAIGATLIYTGLVPLQPYPSASADAHAAMDGLIGDASAFPKVTAKGYSALSGGTSALTYRVANTNSLGVGTGALAAVTTATNDTAVGYNAGLALTTGNNNSAFGYAALAAATTATGNSAFGSLALRFATSNNNSAFGTTALGAVTTGPNNSGFGFNAGLKVTTGQGNSALGYAALAEVTTQSFNAAFGGLALRNATASFNSAFGYNAGTAVTTGAGNVHIGYEAAHLVAGAVTTDQTTTASNQVVVGRQSGGNADQITAIGYFVKATGTNATAIGTKTSATANGSGAFGCDSAGTGAASSTQDELAIGTALHRVKIAGRLNVAQRTPSGSADAQGTTGDIAADDGYVYVKASTGWKRAALAAF